MKPGGNFTQPVYDPLTEETTYHIYVGWQKIGESDNDIDATETLREALNVERTEKQRAITDRASV